MPLPPSDAPATVATESLREPAPNRVGQGIVLMILAIFFFSIMDVLAKALSEENDSIMVVWARYAGQTFWTILFILPSLKTVLRTSVTRLHVLRSVLLFGATASFYVALAGLPIAEATAIFEIAPLVITGLAVVFLGEKVGPRRWAAVAAGLLGALIIIRPGSDVFTPFALLPLLAATCYAAYAIVTRLMPRTESAWTSLFYGGVFGTIISSIIVMPIFAMPESANDLWLFLLIGPVGAAGQYLLILSLQRAPASLLAPFGYVGLGFSALWGVFIFAEIPDGATILGAGIIVNAGLFVWYRERKEERGDGQS